MTTFWVSIGLGLLIVVLAIGIPLYMTHRRMYPRYDRSDARAYLKSTGRSADDVATGGPSRRQGEDLNLKRSHVTTSGPRSDRSGS